MSDQKLIKQLYDTAFAAGIPIISIDKCCRLMAWVYVFGGGCEQVVFDHRLNSSITYAQKRLGIEGCNAPQGEHAAAIRGYIESITTKDRYTPKKDLPNWVFELEKEYKIEIEH